MEEMEIIKSLGGSCLGLIVTIITIIIRGHKNVTNKKRTENLLKISEAVREWIIEVEKYKNYSGEEKKAYVLSKASRYALENNIKYSEEEIGKKIEELIGFSKGVNSKEEREITSWLERK